MIATIEMRLATAGLSLRKIDLDPEPAEQPDGGNSHIGEKNIAQTGDHQKIFSMPMNSVNRFN